MGQCVYVPSESNRYIHTHTYTTTHIKFVKVKNIINLNIHMLAVTR